VNVPLLFLLQVVVVVSQASAQTVRIAPYNVNCSNRQSDQELDAIKTANADIVCLQETTPSLEELLRKKLAREYPVVHSAGHKGTIPAERFTFVSRQELQDLEFHPPAAGLLRCYAATFKFGDHKVHLLSVHLQPFRIRRGAGFRNAMRTISNTELTHANEIKAILKLLDSEAPTIVAGDFNSVATFKAPQLLRAAGFIDSFATVHQNPESHPTWHWPSEPVPLNLRIDYLFHSAHFKTLQSKVVQREGSDHSLVVSELGIIETLGNR